MDDDEAALHGRWSRRRGAWQWTAAAQWSTKNKFYATRDPQYPNGGRTDRYRQQEGWISVGTAHTLSSHWQWAYVMDATRSVLHQHGENEREARRTMVQQALSLRFRDQKWNCHAAALTSRSVQFGTTERPDQPGHGGRRGLLHAARRGANHSFEETANRNGRARNDTNDVSAADIRRKLLFSLWQHALHNERAFA